VAVRTKSKASDHIGETHREEKYFAIEVARSWRDFITGNRSKLLPLTYREASRVLIKQGLMI
jgi:hypothetical protein